MFSLCSLLSLSLGLLLGSQYENPNTIFFLPDQAEHNTVLVVVYTVLCLRGGRVYGCMLVCFGILVPWWLSWPTPTEGIMGGDG
jgi:hypothetical protein